MAAVTASWICRARSSPTIGGVDTGGGRRGRLQSTETSLLLTQRRSGAGRLAAGLTACRGAYAAAEGTAATGGTGGRGSKVAAVISPSSTVR